MNDLTKLFLQRRNYTPQKLQAINNPHHQKLQNIDELCAILKTVHDTHSRIVIMPDFDTDGISAGTVGYSGMAQLGFNVSLYLPIPADGYGIKVSDVENVLKQYPDVKYIITCDVGITCYDAFEYAAKHGIHVLVTDHHEEQVNKPKPLICDVIVNPCQLSETYKLRDICGAHVFYQVLCEYAQNYDQANYHWIQALAVFAGIGTIGDMMPLRNENRALVKKAVTMLRFLYMHKDLSSVFQNVSNTYKNSFLGLQDLLYAFHDAGKLRSINDLDEKFLGWTLVPTYNSVKRLNLSMVDVFGIFFGKTQEYRSQKATLLIKENEKRKQITKDYMAELEKETILNHQPFAPFIYLTDAPGGMLGLIANQLMRQNNVPTFVVNRVTLSGSGRSYAYFNVISELSNSEFDVAGHEQAFGIHFKDLEQIGRFYDYLVKNIVPRIKKEASKGPVFNFDMLLGKSSKLHPDMAIDNNAMLNFYKDVQTLKPFGVGFEEPNIGIGFTKNEAQFTTLSGGKHLKIILPTGLQLISWNHGSDIEKYAKQEESIVAGNLSINEFGGKKSIQLIF